MKTEPKHTPGPWAITSIIDFDNEPIIYIGQPERRTTSDYSLALAENDVARVFDKDDAAFIVEACNNYERIKAERDELAGIVEEFLADNALLRESYRNDAIMERAEAALAKLDKEEQQK